MSLPHEYYGYDGTPHLHERHNDALYADPDYLANEHDDVLPLHSTIGLGPKGDGFIPKVYKEDDEKGTFILDFVSDKTDELFFRSPNLHAGVLSVKKTSSDKSSVTIFLTRNGVKHSLCSLELPKGDTGSRIYTHNTKKPIKTLKQYVANIDTEELNCYGTTLPEPRVWDVVMSNVQDMDKPTVSYLACGIITSVTRSADNKTIATVVFNTFYKPQGESSEQVQVDFNVTDKKDVRYIKNRENIQHLLNTEKYITINNNVIEVTNFATEQDINNIFKGGRNGSKNN